MSSSNNRQQIYYQGRHHQQQSQQNRIRPKRGDDFAANGAINRTKNGRGDGDSDGGGTTTLLTFEKFLATQDESLSRKEAITKYNDYKFKEIFNAHRRHTCEQYFQSHKDEEWFRFKYHPEDSRYAREEQRSNIRKRLSVFNDFLNNGIFDNIQLDIAHSDPIIRLMDAVIVKLEGGTNSDIDAIKDEPIEDESVQDLAAHQLHKTCSVHLRSVPANASIADLENLCKRHTGFLRLAVGDPMFDSRGTRVRPAWVTYRRDVNINEIFWALRRAKLLASDLGVVINRDMKRRVRISSVDADAASAGSVFTSALDSHRVVVANALRQAARLIVLLDLREGLHEEKAGVEEGELELEEEGENFDVWSGVADAIQLAGGTGDQASKLLSDLDAVWRSRNPILAGIVNNMVDESNVEEEFLLERASAADGTPLEITQQYEEDRALIQVLDRLLLYLRIVHSVDFYAGIHYPQEDQMPNRLGLFHVRRIPPSIAAAKRALQLAKSTVDGHVESFNARFENGILKQCTPLCERELQKLGKKDAEKAVEEFVNVNTQQLGPEKWLCLLSGKKFKGPEFVRKHIITKYKEEVDKMRYAPLYFNNFISDPNRPHNPPHKFRRALGSRRKT